MESYRADLARFVRFLAARKGTECTPIGEISRDDVRAYSRSLEDLSPRSRNRGLSALSSFFEWALEAEHVDASPMANIRRPKHSRTSRPCPTEQEMMAVREIVRSPMERVLFDLLAMAGLRRAEIVVLTIDCVDFERCRLRVVGKGNKERIVPLTTDTIEDLQSYLESREECSSSDPLLTNGNGAGLADKTIFNIVKRWVKAAGLEDKGYSPHSFRHFAATRLLNHGVPIHAVKVMMGHESIETTDVYAHTSVQELERALEEHVPGLGCEPAPRDTALQGNNGPVPPTPFVGTDGGCQPAQALALSYPPAPLLIVPLSNSQGMLLDGTPKHIRIDVKIDGGAVEARVTQEPLDGDEGNSEQQQ